MKIDTDYQLSKNFKLADAIYLREWQIYCVPQTEQVYRNIQQTAQKLQLIRDYFDKPVIIHCWLRPMIYNLTIGGSKNSSHITGEAVDFHVDGLSCDEVLKELSQKLESWNIRAEANWGKNWTHIDLRTPGPGGRLFSP